METCHKYHHTAHRLPLQSIDACLLNACTFVGPKAITETDNSQMLMVLIHNRYGERSHLLTVASVTANVSVRTSAGVQSAKEKELLTLLGLPLEMHTSPQIVIPVLLALNSANAGAIGVTTRSVFDMVEILSARIEVPDIDMENGVLIPPPPPGTAGKMLRVHYSESEPEHAYIAVEFRDGCFYIDERDLLTKQYLKLLGSLWSLAMSHATNQNTSAPVLTVPVSR